MISFVTLPGAYGSDCSPINLITEENSPFKEMKVIDQRDLNICYAHAASQLVEYHLRRNGAKERVHPAWLAFLYSEFKNKKKLEIGHTSEALNLINGKSLCDADFISKTLQSWKRRNDLSDIEILSSLEKENPSSVEILGNLFSQCESGRKLELPKVQRFGYRDLPTHGDFEAKLLSSLNSRSPLSISYCANIWTTSDYEGIGFDERNLRDRLKKDCHYHESLVVGRKMIDNSCHLLVRNTWGTDWRKSNKKWNCVCQDKVSGEIQDDCRFEEQRNSEVIACWLPSSGLARNTGVITFLERESSPSQNSIASHP